MVVGLSLGFIEMLPSQASPLPPSHLSSHYRVCCNSLSRFLAHLFTSSLCSLTNSRGQSFLLPAQEVPFTPVIARISRVQLNVIVPYAEHQLAPCGWFAAERCRYASSVSFIFSFFFTSRYSIFFLPFFVLTFVRACEIFIPRKPVLNAHRKTLDEGGGRRSLMIIDRACNSCMHSDI